MRAVIVFVVAAGFAFAATPVASIKSSSDFQLRGNTVRTAGVPSWPILAGDTIISGVSAATIRFKDGSTVNLAPRSQAKVEEEKDGLCLRLLSGFMSFTQAPASLLRFYSGKEQLKAVPNTETTAAAAASGTSDGSVFSGLKKPPMPPTPISRY